MRRELGAAAALYAILAVAMTWPLAARFGTAVPIGGDNLHLAWVLAWIAHAIVHAPLSLFEGNAFHPAGNAIALSDPNVSSALLVAPAWWLGADPGVLVNLLFLGSFVLCGVAAQALAREWGATALGAVAAGLLFAFSPLRFSHVDHVQLYAFWWTPLALVGLDRFFRTGGARPLAAATICLVLQAYASLYLAAFAAAAAALYAVLALARGRRQVDGRRWAVGLATAVVVAIVLCVPLAIAYGDVRITWGATRSLEQNIRFAASPLAFLSVPDTNVLWGRVLAPFTDPVAPWEKQLFPGLATTALALFAVVRDRRGWAVWFGLALALASFVCALGPVLVWPGARTEVALPYLFAWEWLPPMQGLRGPARWALLGSLGLAIAGAAGASRGPRALVVPLLAFALLEGWVWPLPTTPVPVLGASGLETWLARHDDGAVIELPLPSGGEAQYTRETERIYRSTAHWRRLVNGYSGYTPPTYPALREVAAAEPAERLLPILAAWDVRTIVLHKREVDAGVIADWSALVERGLARREYDDEEVVVLVHDLPPPSFERPKVRLSAPLALAADAWSSVTIAFPEEDPPFALPPAMLGWHRRRALWTSDAGAREETVAKVFCPPIVHRGLRTRTLYLVPPSRPGTYRLQIEADCLELDETVDVGSAAP